MKRLILIAKGDRSLDLPLPASPFIHVALEMYACLRPYGKTMTGKVAT